MKIPDAERRRRGLTFHSWRYWYNSMLRGRVPDHALRALTGHHSEAMTERYTEITADQRREIARLANGLVAAPGKRQVARLP
jgi:integrase